MNWRTIKETDKKRLTKLVATGILLRNKRKALEAEAEAVGKEERALKDFLIENFKDTELKEVSTSAGKAKLTIRTIPQMDAESGGWDAIFNYVKKNDAFDLLQKRLHEAACKERWDGGEQIPGVKKFFKKDLKFGDAD